MLTQVDQPVLVLRLSGQVLLPVGVADLWMRGHHNAGPGAVNAGLPGARRIDPAAAVVGGALAQVPDVAPVVLGVPVGGALEHRSTVRRDVGDDRGRHPGCS